MSRYKLPANWRRIQRNGNVWYETLDGRWRADYYYGPRKDKWYARKAEDAVDTYYGPTLASVMGQVNDRLGIKRDVVQPLPPEVSKEETLPGSYMDSAEFFCPCGRRYMVSLVQDTSRV